MPKRRTNNKRDYQRSDRLNELLREVIAQELSKKLDDSDLGLVSVSSVQVDNELTKAKVFLSCLDDEASWLKVSEYKGKLRKAIGDQARIRRVPELEFFLDPAITSGNRIDEILAEIEAKENLRKNES